MHRRTGRRAWGGTGVASFVVGLSDPRRESMQHAWSKRVSPFFCFCSPAAPDASPPTLRPHPGARGHGGCRAGAVAPSAPSRCCARHTTHSPCRPPPSSRAGQGPPRGERRTGAPLAPRSARRGGARIPCIAAPQPVPSPLLLPPVRCRCVNVRCDTRPREARLRPRSYERPQRTGARAQKPTRGGGDRGAQR